MLFLYLAIVQGRRDEIHQRRQGVNRKFRSRLDVIDRRRKVAKDKAEARHVAKAAEIEEQAEAVDALRDNPEPDKIASAVNDAFGGD